MSFDVLRAANRRRQDEWPGNDKADLAFRGLEIAGEAGELSEAIKKFLRAERGIKGSTASLEDIADEMGDVIIAIDLAANELDIDLGVAVARKFTKTSDKHGMTTRLGEQWLK